MPTPATTTPNTPDAARATAQLGNPPDAYGQVWHLPTSRAAPTGREWVERFAAALGAPPRYQIVRPWTVKTLGFLVPLMGEMHEMLYQNDRHYRFDSSKFESRFGWTATPIDAAVRAISLQPEKS